QLCLRDFPARPERSASIQLIGFHHLDVPSSEKVMNSARPPRFSHGTGPPRPPCHSGTRLSAESSRLSPISQTVPGGMVTDGKSSSLERPSSTVSYVRPLGRVSRTTGTRQYILPSAPLTP